MIKKKLKKQITILKKTQKAHLSILAKLPLTSVFGFLQLEQNSFYPSGSLVCFVLLLLQRLK